jgi:hypothetical protein
MIKAVVLRILGDDRDARSKVLWLLNKAEAIDKADPTLKVDANIDPAKARLDALSADASDLRKKLDDIPVSLDDRKLRIQTASMGLELDKLTRRLSGRITERGIIQSQIAADRIALRLDKLSPADSGGGFLGGLGNLFGAFGKIGGLFGRNGTGLAGLGALMTPAGLSALGLLGGTGLGIGAGVLGGSLPLLGALAGTGIVGALGGRLTQLGIQSALTIAPGIMPESWTDQRQATLGQWTRLGAIAHGGLLRASQPFVAPLGAIASAGMQTFGRSPARCTTRSSQSLARFSRSA